MAAASSSGGQVQGPSLGGVGRDVAVGSIEVVKEVESDGFVGKGRVRDEEEDGIGRVVVASGGGGGGGRAMGDGGIGDGRGEGRGEGRRSVEEAGGFVDREPEVSGRSFGAVGCEEISIEVEAKGELGVLGGV